MRTAILLSTLLFPLPIIADSAINCDSRNLTDYEIRICKNRKAAENESLFKSITKIIISGLNSWIERDKSDPIGFGIDPSKTLSNFKLSNNTWLKLVELDCGIEIFSPFYSGGTSSSPGLNDCIDQKYKDRIKQLYIFAEYWEIDVSTVTAK